MSGPSDDIDAVRELLKALPHCRECTRVATHSCDDGHHYCGKCIADFEMPADCLTRLDWAHALPAVLAFVWPGGAP